MQDHVEDLRIEAYTVQIVKPTEYSPILDNKMDLTNLRNQEVTAAFVKYLLSTTLLVLK